MRKQANLTLCLVRLAEISKKLDDTTVLLHLKQAVEDVLKSDVKGDSRIEEALHHGDENTDMLAYLKSQDMGPHQSKKQKIFKSLSFVFRSDIRPLCDNFDEVRQLVTWFDSNFVKIKTKKFPIVKRNKFLKFLAHSRYKDLARIANKVGKRLATRNTDILRIPYHQPDSNRVISEKSLRMRRKNQGDCVYSRYDRIQVYLHIWRTLTQTKEYTEFSCNLEKNGITMRHVIMLCLRLGTHNLNKLKRVIDLHNMSKQSLPEIITQVQSKKLLVA